MSEHYRNQREGARRWLADEAHPYVRRWLEDYIRFLATEIERAETEEE